MRILYFHQHFSTPMGSTGTRSFEMAKRLLHHGHQVTMVCGSYDGGVTGISASFNKGIRRGNVEGIDVVELELPYSNKDNFLQRTLTFLRFAKRCIRIALFSEYDVLFATSTPLTAGIPGIFARWLRRKKFVFEVRDLWPEIPKAMGVISNPWVLGAMSALEWISYKSAHKLIGLSPGMVDGIIRRGIEPENVRMISNGCDLDLFAPIQQDSVYTDHEQPPQLTAIFSGAHGLANGLDAVIDAAACLKKRQSTGIKILLVGRGSQKEALIKRVSEEQLEEIVEFHDSISKSKMPDIFAEVDLGLQILANIPAFYHGTSPNKYFDYISAGLPVLINYPGWLADQVREYGCGYPIHPNDPEAFASALEQARHDKSTSLLKDMKYNARQLAESQFNRVDLSDQWVQWTTQW